MQIKIEIDVKPEELRRFLGLPDVAGLQEDIVKFLRDKVSDANETFDPAGLVKAGLDTIGKSKTWRRIMDGSRAVDEEEAAPARSSRRRRKPDEDDAG